MPDEKKNHDLDADILQSKADILEALRAAGKPAANKPNLSPEQAPDPISEEDILDKADMIDLADDEFEHAVPEEFTSDEFISEFPEEELIKDEPIRIVSFEESKQYNTDSASADSIELPVTPDDSASSKEPDLDIEQLRRNNRQLNDRASTLLEENTRLKADLQDYLQTGNQVQRFRSELSETEVALSREHSKTRLLETKINEIESLKALLEQDCRSFSERIEQLQQEKELSRDTLERIQEEQSDNREKTGRQIVDLNQQIENLTEQRDELQQKANSLGQTVNSLNQEAAALRENTEALSETNQQLENIRAELDGAKSKLSQEQEERSSLEREVEELRVARDENNSIKEQLRSEISGYELQVQHLDTELSALRQQHIQEQNELSAQLQQEKQQSKETLKRLQQEYSEYHEKADSQMGKLDQRIERMSEKADLAKRAYEEVRHEYEAYQSQAGGEIAILTERRDELQQKADSLRQTVDSLNQEVATLRENAETLSETNEQFGSVQAKLEEAKSNLSQEQEEHAFLKQETERLHTASNENDCVKEHLRSEISDYESQVQNVNTEIAALREQYDQEQDEFSAHLRQEKQQFEDTLGRLEQEHSNYREQTGREMVELKTDHERSRQEYKTHQSQADGEIANLKQQLEKQKQLLQEQMEIPQEKGKAEFQNQLEALNKRAEQDKQALKQFGETKALLQETRDEAGRLQKENAALQSQLIQLAAQQQQPAKPIAISTNRDATPVDLIEAEAPPQIPQYNLAEQILSEHRRSTASRRKRIEPATSKEKEGSVENVVKQYVGTAVPAGQTKAERTGLCHNLWDDDSLTLFQRELLQEIIQRDISEYCKN